MRRAASPPHARPMRGLRLLVWLARQLCIFTLCFLGSSFPSHAWAEAGGPSASPGKLKEQDGPPLRVEFQRKTLYELRGDPNREAAQKRKRETEKNLKLALGAEASEPVRVVSVGESRVVYSGKIPLIELRTEDALVYGDPSLLVHADRVALSFQNVIEGERKRARISGIVFSWSLVVLISLVTLFLIKKSGEITDKARKALENKETKIPALRVESLELLSPAAMQSVARLLVEVSKWVLRLGSVSLWLVLCLLQFPATRGLVPRLTSELLLPLTETLKRAALALPIAAVLSVGLAVTLVLSRFIHLFFSAIAKRESEVSWIEPELARPLGALLQLSIVVFSLLFGAPLLTGNPEGLFAKLGQFLLLALSLALVPVLTGAALSLSRAFSGDLKLGARVRIGAHQGTILENNLLGVRLETEAQLVQVPHLYTLWHPLELSPSDLTSVRVPVTGLDAKVLARLEAIASALGTGISTRVLDLRKDATEVEVALRLNPGKTRSDLLLSLAPLVGEVRAIVSEEQLKR